MTRDRIPGRLLLVIPLIAHLSMVRAAELAGIAMPDIRNVAGKELVLNGIALRTYSVFNIRIYVAGLYLEQRSSSAEAILRSPEVKLLEIHFLQNIGQNAAQQAWRRGFANNCESPCRLTPQDTAQFIAKVPAIRRGDTSMFLFTRNGLTVAFNGRVVGTTANHYFARQVLRTFLGPSPPTPRVKRELLGGR
jgi:hypothetical protein